MICKIKQILQFKTNNKVIHNELQIKRQTIKARDRNFHNKNIPTFSFFLFLYYRQKDISRNKFLIKFNFRFTLTPL